MGLLKKIQMQGITGCGFTIPNYKQGEYDMGFTIWVWRKESLAGLDHVELSRRHVIARV